MANKPDGKDGKKHAKASVFKIYVHKLNRAARLQKLIAANGKEMRVPRGSKRAERRTGLVKGWRKKTAAKQMLPP